MARQENIQAALDTFGSNVVRLAQIALGARRKGQRYQKVDGKWKKGKLFNKVIDNSGTLRKSLEYNVKVSKNSFSFDISMEDYGEWVDKGRKKGKGVPVFKIYKNGLKQNLFAHAIKAERLRRLHLTILDRLLI